MEERTVRVRGAPGSGRTTLLGLLYAYLVQQSGEGGREPEFRLFADPAALNIGGELYKRVVSPDGSRPPYLWGAPLRLEVGRRPAPVKGLFRRRSAGEDEGRVLLNFVVGGEEAEALAASGPWVAPGHEGGPGIELAVREIPRRSLPSGPEGDSETAAPALRAPLPSPPARLVLTQWDVAAQRDPGLKLPVFPPPPGETEPRRQLAQRILARQAGGKERVEFPAGMPVYFFGLRTRALVSSSPHAHHVEFATFVPGELHALLLDLLSG